MTGYLLDTSFVVAFFNELAGNQTGPARAFAATMKPEVRLYVSLVVLEEVLEGTDDPRAVETEIRRMARVLSIGDEVARRCALIQRRAKRAGRRMGENDAWIASTAQLAGLMLIGDDHSFENRPGLRYVRFISP